MRKGKYKDKTYKIYGAGLHVIHKAMEGHRLFGSFGFTLQSKAVSTNKGRSVREFENWSYDTNIADYVNMVTGQVMTNYLPDQGLEELLYEIDVLRK